MSLEPQGPMDLRKLDTARAAITATAITLCIAGFLLGPHFVGLTGVKPFLFVVFASPWLASVVTQWILPSRSRWPVLRSGFGAYAGITFFVLIAELETALTPHHLRGDPEAWTPNAEAAFFFSLLFLCLIAGVYGFSTQARSRPPRER